MSNLVNFKSHLNFLLTDIDDTLTDEGLLGPEAYAAIWELHKRGVHVVPITGRPAGWCELIVRQWPVAGIVGENGGFYFRYHDKKMIRHFVVPESQRAANRAKLDAIRDQVLKQVPGTAVASDQFCRLLDLAIDFCEDVPKLDRSQVQKIAQIFEQNGAQAKISSIHVNGWFGSYDKLTESLHFLKTEFGLSEAQIKQQCGFVGDSLNDEPMWSYFDHGFAVANISEFWNDLKSRPQYVAGKPGGLGFKEIAAQILKNR